MREGDWLHVGDQAGRVLLDGVQLRLAGLDMLCELLRVVVQLLRVLHGALEQVGLQPIDLLLLRAVQEGRT